MERFRFFLSEPKSFTTSFINFWLCGPYWISQANNSSGRETHHEIIDEAFFFDGEDLAEEEESDEEDETDSSVDLLIRFLQSMVKKISKRAKKASRSVLPPAISTQLVILSSFFF